LILFSLSASTETTTRPGTINIKIPPGRRHDLSLNINRTNIENYSARNINNDSVSFEVNFQLKSYFDFSPIGRKCLVR